jgi:collagen type III alpha
MFDGKAYGEGIVEIVKGYVEREIGPLKAENESLKARIAALEDRPAPEKGEKGDPGEPGKDGVNGADGKDGMSGKDAAGIVEVLKDSGELVLTLEDGRLIRTGIRDGEKGQDGRDGFGFDDMDVCVLDDDRTIELSFRRGEEEKAFTLKWPTVIYRDIFKAGETYQPGDAVTWAGALWIAQKETAAKPETAESGWKLAVKKGRDGKDAK